jgi:hypothetical protein
MPGTLDAAWGRLTGAIVQLQTSIRAYKTSHENPSQYKLLEVKSSEYPTQHTTASFTLPTEQTTASHGTRASLDILEAQLLSFEQQLKQRRQWHLPPHFSPDPFLLIDLTDLDDAIEQLRLAIDIPRFPQRAQNPGIEFTPQRWEWDPQWYEWYSENPKSGNHIYLTEWELVEESGDWVMVEQGHRRVEEGLAVVGSWEEWMWDEEWGEWYLPLAVEDKDDKVVVKRAIYASEWRKTEEGGWLYVEKRATTQGEN